MWRCGGSDRAGNLRERVISRQGVLARQEAVAEQVREIPVLMVSEIISGKMLGS